ncbi:MAG: hypothetical protein H6622_17215 [Halobacteriovoraceae bacterium]|nr:hypothetical protein [Halobacteriovoraceae bacterium]
MSPYDCKNYSYLKFGPEINSDPYVLLQNQTSSFKGLLSFLMTYLIHKQQILTESNKNEINQELTRNLVPKKFGKKFKIAFYKILADNRKKQGSEKTAIFSNPLNNTNLSWRPVCLQTIVVSQISKIQNHFFHYLNRLTNFLLNFKSSFSTIESSNSKFEALFRVVSFFEYMNFPVERPAKDLDMRMDDYKGQLSGFDSNILYLDSTKLNKTQQDSNDFQVNLASWAREFIKIQKLTKENLKHSSDFKRCSTRQKQAIYYQLRKKETRNQKKNRGEISLNFLPFKISFKAKRKSKTQTKVTKAILTRESLKALIFIGIEAIVLYLSHSFYFQFGFNKLLSWGSASVVEGSYTILSGSQSLGLKALKWLVFIYSAFSVSYSSFVNDPALKKKLDLSNDRIIRKQAQIARINKDLNSAREDKAVIRQAEKGYIEYGKITKGLKNLEVPKRQADETISRLNSELIKAKEELDNLQARNSVKKVFTWENFKSLETKTHSFILLMLLLQVISSSFISSICSTLRSYFIQKEKLNKKKNKGEFYGHVPSYISVQ